MVTIILIYKNIAYTEMMLHDFFLEDSISFPLVNKGEKQLLNCIPYNPHASTKSMLKFNECLYSHFSLAMPSGLNTASYTCLYILTLLQGYFHPFLPFIIFSLLLVVDVQ